MRKGNYIGIIIFLLSVTGVVAIQLDKEVSRQYEPYKIVQSVDKTRNASIEIIYDSQPYRKGDRFYRCINFSNAPKVNVTVRYYGWLKDLSDTVVGNFSGETVIYANSINTCEPNTAKCWDGGFVDSSYINECTNFGWTDEYHKNPGKYYAVMYYYFVNFSDSSIKINPSINISKTEFYAESNVFEIVEDTKPEPKLEVI